MTKEDLIRKLTSRKFWLAIVGFITPLLLAFGATEHTTTQIAAIIMAGADVIVYLFAEGQADAAGAAALPVVPLGALESTLTNE